MKSINVKHALLAASLCVASSSALANIDIVFDYSYDTSNYFGGTQKKDLLTAAASVFETRFGDTLNAITSSGINHFDVEFLNPSTGAATSIADYSIAADRIVVFVGAYNLGGSTLAQGGPGGYNASGDLAFINTVDNRGEAVDDFGPWGGSLAFDSDSNFYFDEDVASDESFSGFDFYSVAVHELGHVLGFGASDSYNALVANNEFTGDAVNALTGSNQPLDPADNAHWASGLSYDGVETSMDPDISVGVRKQFTELDYAAMKDIGWEVSPVPEAQSWAMMLAGVGILGWRMRARKSDASASTSVASSKPSLA